jgi:hypothetical protein
MSTINTSNNANVAYNYQKVPNLVKSDNVQSTAGLIIAMRDRSNLNRNIMFSFPTDYATPNFNINSPTLTGVTINSVSTLGTTYAGKQL